MNADLFLSEARSVLSRPGVKPTAGVLWDKRKNVVCACAMGAAEAVTKGGLPEVMYTYTGATLARYGMSPQHAAGVIRGFDYGETMRDSVEALAKNPESLIAGDFREGFEVGCVLHKEFLCPTS